MAVKDWGRGGWDGGRRGEGEGREGGRGGGKKEKLNLSRMESKVSKHVHEERLGNIF